MALADFYSILLDVRNWDETLAMSVDTDILSGGRGSKTEGSDGSSNKGNRGVRSSRTIERNVLDALIYRGIISQADVVAAVDDSKDGSFDLETVLLDRYRVP